jgi:hypothetical protein
MLEELQFEMSRTSRQMLVQTNFDATACYDRIISNLAMLASQKFGVHPSVTKTNALTFFLAKYHVRTKIGVSTTSYTHSEDNPIYGIGQGSGNASVLWGFISSFLYDIYELKAHPATYCNPDGTNQILVFLIGFVDDNIGQGNKFKLAQTMETLRELLQEITKNGTIWAELLGITGGALELSKCSYRVVYWKFSVQGAPVLMNMRTELTPLTIRHPNSNQDQTLEYLHPYEAHKTLGHY